MGAPALAPPAAAPAAAPAAPAAAPAPAPAQTPSSTPSPSGPSAAPTPIQTPTAPAGGAPSQPGTQPGASSQAPETRLPPTDVPYAKFREVQTEHTRLRQQMAQMEREHGERQRAWEQRQAAIREQEENYQAIAALLNENPDIAEQLYQRVGKGSGATRQPAGPVVDPEITKKLSTIEQWVQSEREQRQRDMQRQADEQAQRQVDGKLQSLLEQTGYSVDAFLPDVRFYVYNRLRTMPDARLEDIPHLFGEWYRRFEDLYNKRVEGLRGAKADAATASPPTPGPTPAAIAQQGPKGAMDNVTSTKLEELLKQRLGWNDAG